MTDAVRPPRTSGHIPLVVSEETLKARRIAEERAARAGGVHADIGQVWKRNSDGTLWRIAGAKGAPNGGHVFALVDETDDVIEVDPDALVDDYTHAGCVHEAACCTTHRTHTSPHKGCILR